MIMQQMAQAQQEMEQPQEMNDGGAMQGAMQ